MIIDTHCHLDDSRYKDDLDAVLQRAKEQGVTRFIIPGADPKTLPKAVELAETYSEIYFAAGVHPYDKDAYDSKLLERYLEHEKCVAVGECGLDYYRLPEGEDAKRIEKRIQRQIFVEQLDLARRYDLPVIVHIREANEDAYEVLKSYAPPKGGVLHCYNASPLLLGLSDLFYYGIGGVLTFKNAKKLVAVFPQIPHDRLVIETDAPYLTPHPHRGERNEPAYCRLVAEKMAELSDLSVSDIESITTKNATKLFGLELARL